MSSEPGKPRILVEHVKGDPAQLPEGVVHAPSRGADDPPRLSRQARVSDDSLQIAEVRALFAQQQEDLFRAALANVRVGGWLFHESKQALKAQPARSAEALARLLRRRYVGPAERASAANALAQLGVANGERALLRALGSPSAPMRAEALKVLRQWDCPVDLRPPARARRAVALIDDPDPQVARAAVELCTFRRLPGTEERLAALLERGGAVDAAEFARKLAWVVETPRGVGAMLPHLFQDRPATYSQWTGYALERVVAHPDPAVSGPVRAAFLAYLLGFEGEQRYDQSLVRDLSAVAGEETLPVLEDVLARAKDPVSRAYALGGIARLRPGEAVSRVLEQIGREGPWDSLLGVLHRHATPADAERILPAVLPDPAEPRPVRLSVVRLVLERLGEAGRRAVEAHAGHLEPDARMWVLWKQRGLDLRSALADLRAAGVIDLPPEEVLARLARKREREEEGPLDLTDPGALKAALDCAGVLVAFDAERDQVPCDHDALLLEFAEASGGRFTPECPVQVWHQQGEEDNAPYTVKFLHRGRLFEFGAENYGDWYDVEAVRQALNFALADAGLPQRYLALHGKGQIAELVFADPAAFVPVAERYGPALSEDASQAMRLGKVYERQGFE
jgi:hypothetical protein